MPIFRLNKTFGVGRGIKVSLNIQAGATRGEVPKSWHGPQEPGKKDRQIHRLKKRVKEQNESIFRLENRLAAAEGPVERAEGAVLTPQAPGVGALPDFVMIGAMRCGTSRLYNLVTRHPHVKPAAAKELHYFDRAERFRRGLDWYRGHFSPPEQKDGQRTITGEATPKYLFDPKVPGRMREVLPDARLIVLLRNPVDRAYSQYHRWARTGVDVPSFEETVAEELAWLSDRKSGVRTRGGRYNQLARGVYADQLARWQEFFDREQMLVVKSEDFFARTADTLELVQDFLGLPRREIELPPRKTGRQAASDYEAMAPDLRRRLEEFFAPHNRRLYELLGRDLGW